MMQKQNQETIIENNSSFSTRSLKFNEANLEAALPIPPKKDEAKGWYSRGYLPHFDVSGLYQAITYRLGDSLPGSASVPPVSQQK